MPPTIGKRILMRCPTGQVVYSAARGNTSPKSHWHYDVGNFMQCREPIAIEGTPSAHGVVR